MFFDIFNQFYQDYQPILYNKQRSLKKILQPYKNNKKFNLNKFIYPQPIFLLYLNIQIQYIHINKKSLQQAFLIDYLMRITSAFPSSKTSQPQKHQIKHDISLKKHFLNSSSTDKQKHTAIRANPSRRIKTQTNNNEDLQLNFINRQHLYGLFKPKLYNYYNNFDCMNVDLEYCQKISRVHKNIDLHKTTTIQQIVQYLTKNINIRCQQSINNYCKKIQERQQRINLQLRQMKRLSYKQRSFCFSSKGRERSHKHSLITQDKKTFNKNDLERWFSQPKQKQQSSIPKDKKNIIQKLKFITRKHKQLVVYKRQIYKNISYATIMYNNKIQTKMIDEDEDGTNNIKFQSNKSNLILLNNHSNKRVAINRNRNININQNKNEFSDVKMKRQYVNLELKKKSMKMPRKQFLNFIKFF